ncbi:hypothetical protein MKEN_00623800 [Mycena kentingensis (nom. inval.)]|nr:hypothetical protein MKEN_00623800 [Mycena kentingensis (nom. inval.)]
MASSARKDRCHFLSIHPLTSGVRALGFEAAYAEFIDAFQQLGVVNRRMVKMEVLVPNVDLGASAISSVGLPTDDPAIVAHVVTETMEDLMEIFQDEQFAALLARVKEFGHHEGASFCVAQARYCIDNSESASHPQSQEKSRRPNGGDSSSSGHTGYACYLPRPAGLSFDAFFAELKGPIDGFMALLGFKDMLLHYDVWIPVSEANAQLEHVGLHSSRDVVVVTSVCTDAEQAAKVIEHPGLPGGVTNMRNGPFSLLEGGSFWLANFAYCWERNL